MFLGNLNFKAGSGVATPRPGAVRGDVTASAPEIIELAREGKMFILVDDEDRENEGDLIIPADAVTPEAITFMAMHGRGLICLSLDGPIVDKLQLPMMPSRNPGAFDTAFTVSIEAAQGVTTGISSSDRACTITAAVDPEAGPTAITTPGHIFPLRARDGGVLVRPGHTEASVDIAGLAGRRRAAVICEIVRDNGEMARLHDLFGFAERHGLRIGTIRDLVAFRRTSDDGS